MANTVATYRVVRSELLVGHSVRTAGDFVPEAETWESLQAHLRTNTIELVYVEKKILDAAIKSYADIEKARVAAETGDLSNPVEAKVIRKRIVKKKVVQNDNEGNTLQEHSV